MKTIQFTAIVGEDGVIHPPAGVVLPLGEIDVVLTPKETPRGQRPPPGICKGMITYIAPDFDEPLEDMKEYME